MIIPWIIFILTVISLSSRLNFISSLVNGVVLQIAIALLILNFDKICFRPWSAHRSSRLSFAVSIICLTKSPPSATLLHVA